jgi:hypothetical protein
MSIYVHKTMQPLKNSHRFVEQELAHRGLQGMNVVSKEILAVSCSSRIPPSGLRGLEARQNSVLVA